MISNGYKNGNTEVQELTSDWMGSDQCGKATFSHDDIYLSMVSRVLCGALYIEMLNSIVLNV